MYSIYTSPVMLVLLGLLIKHVIIDFPLQGPYQYLNKGTYGHPGGLLHSGLQAVGTFAVLAFVLPTSLALELAALDYFVHYHIDWAKMNLNKKLGWGPTTHEQFWWLLGADQFMHLLTYWVILGFVITP